MSSTTSTSTTAGSSNTNVGSTFGGLKYNLNSMLGWRLGDPTLSDILLYSDLVGAVTSADAAVYYDFYTGSASAPLFTQYSTTYTDQTLSNAVSSDEIYSNQLVVSTVPASQYATQFASLDGLFGMT